MKLKIRVLTLFSIVLFQAGSVYACDLVSTGNAGKQDCFPILIYMFQHGKLPKVDLSKKKIVSGTWVDSEMTNGQVMSEPITFTIVNNKYALYFQREVNEDVSSDSQENIDQETYAAVEEGQGLPYKKGNGLISPRIGRWKSTQEIRQYGDYVIGMALENNGEPFESSIAVFRAADL